MTNDRNAINRNIALAGAGLIGAGTFAVSAVTLYTLGGRAIAPVELGAALPLSLDVVGALGAWAWITDTDPKVRRWGQALALAALAGTLVGNGLEAAIHTGYIPVTLPLVLAIGATIPLALWSVVHLVALMVGGKGVGQSRSKGVDGRKSTGETGAAASTAPRPDRPRQTPRVGAGSGSKDEVRDQRNSRAKVAQFMVAWRAENPQGADEAQQAYSQRENDAVRAQAARDPENFPAVGRATLNRARTLSRELEAS